MRVPRAPLTIARAVFSSNPQTKYEARFAVANMVANRLGFYTYNMNLLWPDDPEAKAAAAAWGQGLHLKDRKYVLFSMAQACAHLDGETVECGVFDGAGSFLICLATEGTLKAHHAFDSFEGLSTPLDEDLPNKDEVYRWEPHDLSFPVDRVKQNLRRFPFVVYHVGWIPERFEEVEDRTFSFVHVDVDLYQPSLDSIAFFYDRLVRGGILLCDDYGSTACPGAKKAFDEFISEKSERRVISLPTGQGFIVKR